MWLFKPAEMTQRFADELKAGDASAHVLYYFVIGAAVAQILQWILG